MRSSSSESLPGDGKLLRSDARVETLHSDAVMAYTILPLWFGPTIMPHRVSRLLADAPVRFSRTLVTTSDIPAGASGSSADFDIALPLGRIAGWLATVTSLATDLHSWRDRMIVMAVLVFEAKLAED